MVGLPSLIVILIEPSQWWKDNNNNLVNSGWKKLARKTQILEIGRVPRYRYLLLVPSALCFM